MKTEATAEDWAHVREKTRRAREAMTPDEDAAITADALQDPDNPPIEDGDRLAPLKRPFDFVPEERAIVRIDRDVIERFRKAGDDWEERINAILREAAPADAAE
ncbi:BrnA antitoxin family protein [Jiella pacifica]|uniref:BrnA antitoxin family protein n=1 Tax=Jiella pacifica TaxID=2696469 RepID=UPI0028AEADBE|nr:BrnA antitoxin family protein [Jiella pacifica]